MRRRWQYYLRTNGVTPMLCACDTFRAGAVEQLRVHSQSLELPLYEKGYGRDASGIATDGIAHAKQMGYDCVLVDTAGRMQDNEPLMRSLSKLVTLNNPDLVLFVGVNGVGKSTSLSKVAVRARRRPDRAPAAASFV